MGVWPDVDVSLRVDEDEATFTCVKDLHTVSGGDNV